MWGATLRGGWGSGPQARAPDPHSCEGCLLLQVGKGAGE